jgi:hypothetical protein
LGRWPIEVAQLSVGTVAQFNVGANSNADDCSFSFDVDIARHETQHRPLVRSGIRRNPIFAFRRIEITRMAKTIAV